MITFLNLGKQGRFANALYEIAGTIGVAVKNGQSYAFPTFINHDARDRFGSTEDVDVHRHFVNPLPVVPDTVQFTDLDYFWGYQDLNLYEGNWNLNAHFQSPKFFDHCIDLIRHYFTMKDEEEYQDVIALHIRRGDYDDNYHPLLQADYYCEALKHVPAKDILVFSDDMEAAAEVMEKVGLPYIPVDGDYIECFKMMKRCSHFICANSSYSMMAAILSEAKNKTIVAPKNWFGAGWGDQYTRDWMASSIYPENCIVV